MHKLGLQVWHSPDVMVLMSRGTLCKMAMLSSALKEALAYCTVEEFAVASRQSLAFQTCVIRHNRCSPGEATWIIVPSAGNHCCISIVMGWPYVFEEDRGHIRVLHG